MVVEAAANKRVFSAAMRVLPKACFLSGLLVGAGIWARLPNGSFEQDRNSNGVADGWYLEVHDGAEGTAAMGPGVPGRGGQSQQVIHQNESAEWVRVSVSDVPASASTTYRMTGWVKATGHWDVLLYEFVHGGPYITHRIGGGGASDWRRISAVIRTTEAASTFKVSLVTSGKCEAWFDAFALRSLGIPPALRVRRLREAPVVDGVLEAAVWEQASVADDFLRLGGDGKAAGTETSVRLGFHGHTLYVAWHCEEPRMDEQRISDPPTWSDDTVELFLAPAGMGGAYYQFGVTPGGGKLSSVKGDSSRGFYRDWYSSETTGLVGTPALPDWSAEVRRMSDHWTVEMAVDLSNAPDCPLPWRLQCARSRKLRPDIEENSCWAYTPGETFHQREYFGRAGLPFADAAAPERISPREFRLPELPTVTPRPKRVDWRAGESCVLASPLGVYLEGSGSERAFRVLQRECLRRLGFGGVVSSASPGSSGVHLVLTNGIREALLQAAPGLLDWQVREGYRLEARDGRIHIGAADPAGLLFGVQTLLQLLASDGTSLHVPGVAITDWPDMHWRGWHLIAPEKGAYIEQAKRVVDVLAGLKLNWVAFQIDNRLVYSSHPEASRRGAPTKGELRELVLYAESYGLEVIPMTQCWSHFSYFLSLERYRALAEIPDPPAAARRKYWNYCPRHPETHPFLFALMEEQLECFPHARFYHAGLDEITFEKIGVCERCRSANGGELLAEEVGRIHRFLKHRGLRMCMWGDQLLAEHNGGPPHKTAEALPKVPRDIVMFDWHYGRNKAFPSVPFFTEKGFDVVACGWYEPENVCRLSAEAFRNHALGYGGTTWYAMHRIREESRLMSAIPLTALATWSRDDAVLERLDESPKEIFRRIHDGIPDGQPAGYRPLHLDAFFNSFLSDSPQRPGWLGMGPEHDLSALPTGRQWFAGVPFAIPSGTGKQCLVLAAEGDTADRFPREVWHIPVRRVTREVAMLQTCGKPKAYSRHIYDRRGVNPGTVVSYVFEFEDGVRESVPLRWNVAVSDWNSQLGSARAETGWLGKTRAGALARVEVFRWRNPRPDVPLESIDIVSGMSTAQPVLLGITLVE